MDITYSACGCSNSAPHNDAKPRSRSVLSVKKVLFLLLLFPLLLFVFFVKLGKNEYALPVYCRGDLDHVLERNSPEAKSCAFAFDSLLKFQGNAVIFFANFPDSMALKEALFQFSRSLDAVGESGKTPPTAFLLSCTTGVSVASSFMVDSVSYQREKLRYHLLTTHNTILIDKNRRARGYYDVSSWKEANRLTAEMLILLQEKD